MRVYSKISKRELLLKTAIKLGLFQNPQNFRFDFIIRKSTGREISHTNANRLILGGKATLSDFLIPSNYITYKNRIYINNKVNQAIIDNKKQLEFYESQKAKRKNVIEELKKRTYKPKKFIIPPEYLDKKAGRGYFSFYNIALENNDLRGYLKFTLVRKSDMGIATNTYTQFYNVDDRPLREIFEYDPNEYITIDNVYNGSYVIVEKISNDLLQTQYANQAFKDSEDKHCLLSPILSHFEKQKKYEKRKDYVQLVKNYIEKYSDGIPESDIQKVCDNLNISIEILDLFKRQTLKFASSNSRHSFTFINQRYNHVEEVKSIQISFFDQKFDISEKPKPQEAPLLSSYSLDTKNSQYLPIEKLKEKLNELVEKGENPLYQINGNNDITCIYSAGQGVFALEDPYKTIKEKFDSEINLKHIRFISNDYNICDFLDNASRTTTHQLFHYIYKMRKPYSKTTTISDYECIFKNIKEYDLKKAYSQFKSNKYYVGFPSKLTNYQLINQPATKEFLENNIGYFYIDNVDYTNTIANTARFLKALGVVSGIYSTPELLLFLEHGLQFTLSYGLWSIVPYDFEFSEEMLTTGYYKKWTGQLNMLNRKIRYHQKRLPNQEKFIGHLLATYPEEISVFSDTLIFSRPIKNIKTYKHIGGFITAYTRSMMITELLQHNYDDILALKLDSFVCKDYVKPFNPLFVEKPVKVLNSSGFPFMNQNPIYTHNYNHLPPTSEYDSKYDGQIILLNGQGGSGKTHFILTNQGYINKIYSAVPWRLCVEKQKDYNIKSISFASLSGKEFEVDKKIRKSQPYFKDREINPSGDVPSNIIIDEMTMLTNKDIEEVILNYPYSKIWFIGDVNSKGKPYQTTFGEENFDISKMKTITFTSDYRSKCDKLKKLKLELRKIRDLSISNSQQILEIYKHIKSNFKFLKLAQIKDIYNVNDWILCATKEGDKSRASEINKVIDGEKYRVISHSKKDIFNRLNENPGYYLNGDWIIGEKPNISESRYEKTNASTIHSVQGLTVEEDNKIFIDFNQIFDVNLIYTAISRARNINQLYFFIC